MGGENSTNVSGTYAWMVYQLCNMWMSNLRNSFYISSDTAKLAPLYDYPLTFEEAVDKFNEHMASTAELRAKMSEQYSEGIQILNAIFESSNLPLKDRTDIVLDEYEDDDGNIVQNIKTKKEMRQEMEDIISKYERGEEVSALEIALKNAYAMYFNRRPFDEESLKAEIYIVNQVMVTINEALEVMGNLLQMVPKLRADYIYELTAKGVDRYEKLSKEKVDQQFFKEVGGLLRPFIDSEIHLDLVESAKKANYKGMGKVLAKGVGGKSIDRYGGKMEIQEFSYRTPVLYARPGAGKNSIVAQIAEAAGANSFTINLPQTTESDFSSPAYNPKRGVVSSSLTGNMYEIGTTIGALLGDECLRVNREGRTGMDNLQDFMLHGTFSPQNQSYKRHPGSFVVFATNTDRDSKVGETEQIGQANKDRCVFFEITDEMSKTGRVRYLQQKYGKKLKSGTPLHAFYEFLASNDENLGAGPLLNKADIAITSNYKDMSTPQPSGRPMTDILWELMRQGQHNVTMESICETLRANGGHAFEARFRAFAKVAGSIPSVDSMLDAANNVPYVLAVSSYDVRFNNYDRESGQFKLSKSDISPEVMHYINGGKGVPKEIVEKLEKDKSNFLIGIDGKPVERVKYIETAARGVESFERAYKAKKDPEEKAKWKGYYEEAVAAKKYIESLDSAKLAEDIEATVKKIYSVNKNAGDTGEKVPVSLDSTMVQKLLADRIMTSFESYIDSCYIARGGKTKPMDETKLRQFMTLIFMCPFANQRDNMMSQVRNLLIKTPSETTLEGLFNLGFVNRMGGTVSGKTIESNNKDLKQLGKSAVLYDLFSNLPVVTQGYRHSKNVQNLLEQSRGDVSIGSGDVTF